jgi:SAM-dependent methyltransferase
MRDQESSSAFGRIADYYDRLVNKYGHDPRAADYGRASSQAAKFKVLAEALPLNGASVLDVGCGFADFADFILALHRDVEYHGIDVSPRMVEEARKLHPGVDIRNENLTSVKGESKYDLVVANGIFYLLGEDAWGAMQQLIKRMFILARRAVAFNTLSTWATVQEPGEFYACPEKTLEFCRTLTPRIVLRHDYLRHDFTIYLYRDHFQECDEERTS